MGLQVSYENQTGVLAIIVASFFEPTVDAQTLADGGVFSLVLHVPSGAPLRLYLTSRVSKRVGAPVEAKLMDPTFAFDRQVIPAGTIALGRVSRTQAVGKWQRLAAILNGDFTPIRRAQVEFTTLKLPDGRRREPGTSERSNKRSNIDSNKIQVIECSFSSGPMRS